MHDDSTEQDHFVETYEQFITYCIKREPFMVDEERYDVVDTGVICKTPTERVICIYQDVYERFLTKWKLES